VRPVEVAPVPATGLAGPLALLGEALRDGDPVPEDFVDHLRRAVEAGDVEVLVAGTEEWISGVVILAYRLNFSLGGQFASIEDLYVRPEARRRGVGRTLLETVEELCAERGISYVEVQVEDDEVEAFYAAAGYKPESGVKLFSRTSALRQEAEG
jgi:GNAT superfamily N-acetyltransferase